MLKSFFCYFCVCCCCFGFVHLCVGELIASRKEMLKQLSKYGDWWLKRGTDAEKNGVTIPLANTDHIHGRIQFLFSFLHFTWNHFHSTISPLLPRAHNSKKRWLKNEKRLTSTCSASSGCNVPIVPICSSAQCFTASLASRYCCHNSTARWYLVHKSRRLSLVSFHAVSASSTAFCMVSTTLSSHESSNGCAVECNSFKSTCRSTISPDSPCTKNNNKKQILQLIRLSNVGSLVSQSAKRRATQHSQDTTESPEWKILRFFFFRVRCCRWRRLSDEIVSMPREACSTHIFLTSIIRTLR